VVIPVLQNATAVLHFLTNGISVPDLANNAATSWIEAPDPAKFEIVMQAQDVIGGAHTELLDSEFLMAAQTAYNKTIAFGMQHWGTEDNDMQAEKVKGYDGYHTDYVKKFEKHLKAWLDFKHTTRAMTIEQHNMLHQIEAKIPWVLQTCLFNSYTHWLQPVRPDPLLCAGFVNAVSGQMDMFEKALEAVRVSFHDNTQPSC
jgi:hypothetical protein